MAMTAIVLSLAPGAATSRAVAPAAFELPSPTGRYAVGTTSWRLADASRRKTFTSGGEPRSVEVLAWYPAAAPRRGQFAPYLREGLPEVRTFATLFGVPETAFDALATSSISERLARITGSTCGIPGISISATWSSGVGRFANAPCWGR